MIFPYINRYLSVFLFLGTLGLVGSQFPQWQQVSFFLFLFFFSTLSFSGSQLPDQGLNLNHGSESWNLNHLATRELPHRYEVLSL